MSKISNKSKKYKKIYTIGCFDWFHYGHRNLLNRMKKYGDYIIVGVHDDKSIEQLKNLEPHEHENVYTRMDNVKTFADLVYVIPHRDPTFFLNNVISDDDNKKNSCFIRGNDMPNFPGRQIIEDKIDIILLPYTGGISSTEIRKSKL